MAVFPVIRKHFFRRDDAFGRSRSINCRTSWNNPLGTAISAITATTVDEEEPQLLNQEIVSDRVALIEDALTLIKMSIAG